MLGRLRQGIRDGRYRSGDGKLNAPLHGGNNGQLCQGLDVERVLKLAGIVSEGGGGTCTLDFEPGGVQSVPSLFVLAQ